MEWASQNAVLQTARASLLMQIIFTGATVASLGYSFPERLVTLRNIAALETVSQVVEFSYYMYLVLFVREIRTWTRYLDWAISTPSMLVSLMAFFAYLGDETLGIDDIFRGSLLVPSLLVLGFNWAMLLFGFLMERGLLPALTSIAFGMVCFAVSFAVLFAFFARHSGGIGVASFLFTYVVWGLYGVAALGSANVKNIAYNMLDILSKNFYGVFLFVYITQRLSSEGDDVGSGSALM